MAVCVYVNANVNVFEMFSFPIYYFHPGAPKAAARPGHHRRRPAVE